MKRDNRQKVLGKSALNYGETHRKFATYLWNAAEAVQLDKAHIAFHQRGSVTRASVRARVPGEECPEKDEGFRWLFDLSSKLKTGQSCGVLTITPNGAETDITVRQ